jgi:hypothetical protein
MQIPKSPQDWSFENEITLESIDQGATLCAEAADDDVRPRHAIDLRAL